MRYQLPVLSAVLTIGLLSCSPVALASDQGFRLSEDDDADVRHKRQKAPKPSELDQDEPKTRKKPKKKSHAIDEEGEELFDSKLHPRKAKNWYEPGKYATMSQAAEVEETLNKEYGMKMDDAARTLMDKITQNVLKRFSEAEPMDEDDGEDLEEEFSDLGEWSDKIGHIESHPEAYKTVVQLAHDLTHHDPTSETAAILKKRLRFITELPWDKMGPMEINLAKVRGVLDEDHFGLQKPKERILEYLSVLQRNPNNRGLILCFVGPPGVGKTTLAVSIAKAIGTKFERISLGGVHDEAAIRGSMPVYVGSAAGKPMRALKNAGINNPLVLLDEVDKIGKDSTQGSPADALLEVLDPAQNKNFEDHFIDLPYDLSNVLFVCTANTTDTIPEPLLNRMEIIHLSSYTPQEKLMIAKRYLFPKAYRDSGLRPNEMHIKTSTFVRLIHEYTEEAGVRKLEKLIKSLCAKVVKRNAETPPKQYIIEPQMLEEFLGIPKTAREKPLDTDMVGHVQGMYYTPVGGGLLPVQVATKAGKGELIKTGNVGNLIKESIDYAFTLVMNMLPQFGLTQADFEKVDFHLHAYDAASPKDGPSAGAAITTALLSAVTKIPVDRHVCMTGEINLDGNILRIGGLREKLIGAHRAGMKIALIPKDNVADLEEVPDEVKKDLKITPVSHISEVIKIALKKPEIIVVSKPAAQQAGPKTRAKSKEKSVTTK